MTPKRDRVAEQVAAGHTVADARRIVALASIAHHAETPEATADALARIAAINAKLNPDFDSEWNPTPARLARDLADSAV
ncbi:MAG: hypothetical protein F4233_06625 [Rhodospirillaceae bacterium]|nr:hypothetical protein [Rhodospirillaceae bacterium]